MASVNKCIFVGNLTRDPELRVTNSGTPICQFGLAVNRKYKGSDGSQKEEVLFLDMEAWEKTAQLAAKYLTKGSPVYLECRARMDAWEDKDSGQKRSRIKFVVQEMQFLGKSNGATNEQHSQEQALAPTHGSGVAPTANDEPLPF